LQGQVDPCAPSAVLTAKFRENRSNESPVRGENADIRPVSKFNTGSLPFCGNPAGNKALCIACGFFCSTAAAALQVETGEMALALRRSQQEIQYAVKVKATENHPTRSVTQLHWTIIFLVRNLSQITYLSTLKY